MKKNHMTRVIGIAMVFLTTVPAMAQIFPEGGLPMIYNGGFAGAAGKHRFVSSTRFAVYKAETRNARVDQNLSYDVFVPSLRSGIGIMAGSYISNASKPVDSMHLQLRSSYVSIAFSPKISFEGKWTLAPFVDFQFVNSQSDAYYRPDPSDPPIEPDNARYTLRAGVLLNSEKGYVGLTFMPLQRTRIDEPNYFYRYSHFYYDGDVDTRLIIQAGRTFQKNQDSKFSFTPQFAFAIYRGIRRTEFALPDINFAFRFNRFLTGVGTHGLQFAYNWERLRLGTVLAYFKARREYSTPVVINGQLTSVRASSFTQIISIRYMIDVKDSRSSKQSFYGL